MYHEAVFKVLEDLEPRIAPAVFLISGGTVVDSQGNDATSAYQDDADAVGATKAVLLKKGDSLMVDVDGDGKYTKGTDTLAAKIKGGASLMFFTETNESEGIDVNEISGLAVSNKFGGELNADVHGDIATVLNADKTLNLERLADAASISKLTINGFVDRSITATGSISALTIESAPGQRSVAGIATGDYDKDGANLSFGGDEFHVGRADVLGKSTSISKISINGGVNSINAGSNFGKGGSITDVTIKNTIEGAELRIEAGRGVGIEKAADGGSISKIRIEGERLNDVLIYAGGGSWGEESETNFDGGAGGSIENVTVLSGASTVDLDAGNGGEARSEVIEKANGSTSIKGGRGGAAGSISDLVVAEAGIETLELRAGSAGTSLGKSKDEKGGSITAISAIFASDFATVSIEAGAGGGAQKSGAAGGSIDQISLIGDHFDSIDLIGGDAGSSQGGNGLVGSGGAGGGISNVSVESASAGGEIGSFMAMAGAGGGASFLTQSHGEKDKYFGGTGGVGGSVENIVISNLVAGWLGIEAGPSGASTYKFNGPAGGSVSGVKAVVADLSQIEVVGGEGGSADTDFGASFGPMGTVSNVDVTQAPATT